MLELGARGAGCWVFRVLGAESSQCCVLDVEVVQVAGCSWCSGCWVLGGQGVQGARSLEFKVLGAGCSGCSRCLVFPVFRVLGPGCSGC